jgi:hypothetical protein
VGFEARHIIDGNSRNTLLAEVFTDQGTGTMISTENLFIGIVTGHDLNLGHESEFSPAPIMSQ